MPKGQPHSSNCVYLEGQLQEVIAGLDHITLADLRRGDSIMPIVQAIIRLQTLKEKLATLL